MSPLEQDIAAWNKKCLDHTAINLSAVKLHAQFDELLKNLSFEKIHIEYLYNSAYEQMAEQIKAKTARLTSVRSEYDALIVKLDSLEEKYINNTVSQDTYTKWYRKYKTSESALKYELDSLENNNGHYWELFEQQLPKLEDIKHIYDISTLVQKQALIKGVFNSELWYEGGVYRTPYLLELFQPKALILKGKRLLVYEKPLEKIGKNPVSAPGGT